MSIEIDFTYLIDGSYDRVNYYRSESTMNPDLMPPPTTTNIISLNFTDTSAENGKTYYVRFGSLKGSIEKISDEIIVKTARYLIDLPLTTDLTDYGLLGLSWIKTTGVTFSEDGAFFPSNVDNFISQNTHSIDFNSNFKITFEFKRITSTSTFPVIFDNDDDGSWSSGKFGLQCRGSTLSESSFKDRLVIAQSGSTSIPSTSTISNNLFYNIEITRVNNVFQIKQNGVTVLTSSASSKPISVIKFLRLGFTKSNGANGRFNGYIRNFRLHEI